MPKEEANNIIAENEAMVIGCTTTCYLQMI